MTTLDRDMLKGNVMSGMTLVKTRIQAGIWEGVLTTALPASEPPDLRVTHQGQPITTVAVTSDEDNNALTWSVRIAIPPEVLSDGVQTFLIEDGAGETLESFSIITGEPLDDSIRAEVDLLRAELDMLKSAFRRHCVETT